MTKPAMKGATRKAAEVSQRQRAARNSVSTTATHEQQARDAARRILSGELDAARLLTGAPAAARLPLQMRESRGMPLPGALRDRLEAGFGADLGAVRVHADTVASAAAEDLAAVAFAAGRDIYFARPGTDRPRSCPCLAADGPPRGGGYPARR
ncbi:MAG: DUF4157 domain-containing protein [Chloroflexi bacterium]|nr:DUF4157 domain-containing protein [Chloroflexota bacterium]